MPGRSFTRSGGDYRFGFNGMEKDGEEWTGSAGSHLDFGARIYDSRLGKWMSIDPLYSSFPSESSYSFAGNSPIYLIDKAGKFKYPADKAAEYKKNYPMLTKYLAEFIQNDVIKSQAVQDKILLLANNSSLTKERLINEVFGWSEESSITIDIGPMYENANAYTTDMNNFIINEDYAKHIESYLSDENISEADKQAAIFYFYKTVIDETTIALNMEGNYLDGSSLTNQSDRIGSKDVGDVAVQELFYEYETQIYGQTETASDVAGMTDTGRGDFSGTKETVRRLRESGKSELIPTIPK